MPQKYKTPEEFRVGGSKRNRIVARMVEYYGVSARQACSYLEQHQSADLCGDVLVTYNVADERLDEQFNREFDFLYDNEPIELPENVPAGGEEEWNWCRSELARRILDGRVKPRSPRLFTAWAHAMIFGNDGGDPLFQFSVEKN